MDLFSFATGLLSRNEELEDKIVLEDDNDISVNHEQHVENNIETAYSAGSSDKEVAGPRSEAEEDVADVSPAVSDRDDMFVTHTPPPGANFEILLPALSATVRDEYMVTSSTIVEQIVDEIVELGITYYDVEFSDGNRDTISREDLAEFTNGRSALHHFKNGAATMGNGLKRKAAPEEEWDSDMESEVSDPMDLDETEVSRAVTRRRGVSDREMRALRTRALNSNEYIEDDSDDILATPETHSKSRTLRPRMSRNSGLTGRLRGYESDEMDELDEDTKKQTNGDDAFMPTITSDLMPTKGRPRRGHPSRRKKLTTRNGRSAAMTRTARRGSDDSDIEFEAPRRSARSTRNVGSMYDEAMMDEESFYVVDEKSTEPQKSVSVREIFPPVSPDSSFAATHMKHCHVCGGSKSRGQLVYCQGCTLTFHRHCLGPRSARDHLATKVESEKFVLQCRFCIDIYRKKDKKAPKQSMCQTCNELGQACTPFSVKRPNRQEEKLREDNDGVDPVTSVDAELIDNPEIVLFRCVKCHRGWHIKHLPSAGSDPVSSDIRSERFKDYAVDWHCNECSTARHKIHRLVAWRPVAPSHSDETNLPTYDAIDEDGKDYLVKWETQSYAHCTWMPGAWIYGFSAAAMRSSFGKRALEQDLLKLDEKSAIPDEFLMPDVILNVKLSKSSSRDKSKSLSMADIGSVSKILVKFQGLGYEDVVWDAPPSEDAGDIYRAFVDAFWEYVERKSFKQESANKIRERVKEFKASRFEQVDTQPDGLKRGKLMAYQVEGLNWLLQNYHRGRSVVLADEMGLGKTVQVISLVVSLIQDNPKCWPFLIVVPNATCPNWRREFKQWAPDLRVVTYHGGKEPQELAYKYELFPDDSKDMKAHVVIMSYDSAQDPRTKELFKSVHWTGLVVDEGQRLKNDQNLLYLALRAMKIPFRLLLTGTPLQNNKRELFNLLQFIDESQDAAKLDEEYQTLDKDNLPKLHDKIRPYFLRRTKAGVLKFLPPMAQIILPVTMTGLQEKLSKSIMAKNPQLIKAMFANSKMNKAERGSLNNILMQLRKCLCHPFIYSDAIEEKNHDPVILHRNLVEASAKLILLEIMLPKLQERGHRVLIFSQFLHQLDIIEDFLAGLGFGYRRLDGQISSLEKQRRIDAFNAPDSPIFAFLLSTRAGGVGINLATADTVIIMDPDFNPHQDIQAISRAHRIGQKQKVLCFQLMTKDSIEERIMQVGRKKMALDHALIESMDDDELAGDDLESILKHGAQALFNESYEKKQVHYDAAAIDKLLDRTQVEQTKTTDEGSADAQFSYARVWANDKSTFDEGLAIEEAEAPEPINSSVWDQILADREEEARKEAERNKEVLGRGGRRRIAINYKTNTIEGVPMPDEADLGFSDSSDDEFAAAAESADGESDVDAKVTAKDAEAEVANLRPTDSENTNKFRGSLAAASNAQQANGQPQIRRPRGRPPRVKPAPPTIPNQDPRSGEQVKGPSWTQGNLQHAFQAASDGLTGVPAASTAGVAVQYYAQNGQVPYINGVTHYAQPGWPPAQQHQQQTQYYAQAQGVISPGIPYQQYLPTWPGGGGAASEAILRVEIDRIQHTEQNKNAAQQQKMVLLQRIHELRQGRS